jgi:hypothetical protein
LSNLTDRPTEQLMKNTYKLRIAIIRIDIKTVNHEFNLVLSVIYRKFIMRFESHIRSRWERTDRKFIMATCYIGPQTHCWCSFSKSNAHVLILCVYFSKATDVEETERKKNILSVILLYKVPRDIRQWESSASFCLHLLCVHFYCIIGVFVSFSSSSSLPSSPFLGDSFSTFQLNKGTYESRKNEYCNALFSYLCLCIYAHIYQHHKDRCYSN